MFALELTFDPARRQWVISGVHTVTKYVYVDPAARRREFHGFAMKKRTIVTARRYIGDVALVHVNHRRSI